MTCIKVLNFRDEQYHCFYNRNSCFARQSQEALKSVNEIVGAKQKAQFARE